MRASAKPLLIIVVLTAAIVSSLPSASAAKPGANPALGPVRTVLPLTPPAQPEGIVLDRQGNMYLSMVFTGDIWKITPDGTQTVLAHLKSDPGGATVAMAIDAPGNLYVAHASHSPGSATADTHGLWKITPDGTKILLGAIPDVTGTPNQVVLGQRGNIYVSDSQLGVIWRVDRDGQVTKWLDDPLLKPRLPGDNPCNHTALGDFPVGVNGLAFAPGGTLYAANEDRGVIVTIDIDPRTGAPGTPQVFLQSCTDLVGLDQIAFDTKGNLYAALNTPNKLIRITPDKQVEVLATAADGLAFPANIAFGTGHRAYGTDSGNRRELYITNIALLGGSPSVQVVDVGIPGRPLP
jgi:sugar lactone lactonase YvrE